MNNPGIVKYKTRSSLAYLGLVLVPWGINLKKRVLYCDKPMGKDNEISDNSSGTNYDTTVH